MAALLAGDPERAVTSLAAVWQHTVREGVADPGAFPVAGDLAEALAETGQVEAAAEVIARLRGLAAAQQHPWGLATADRAQAVAALAHGYDAAAAARLAGAAAACRALGLGWDAPGRSWFWAAPSGGPANAPPPGTACSRPGPGSSGWAARAGRRRPPPS